MFFKVPVHGNVQLAMLTLVTHFAFQASKWESDASCSQGLFLGYAFKDPKWSRKIFSEYNDQKQDQALGLWGMQLGFGRGCEEPFYLLYMVNRYYFIIIIKTVTNLTELGSNGIKLGTLQYLLHKSTVKYLCSLTWHYTVSQHNRSTKASWSKTQNQTRCITDVFLRLKDTNDAWNISKL